MAWSVVRQVFQHVACSPVRHVQRGTRINAIVVLGMIGAVCHRHGCLFGSDDDGGEAGAFVEGLPEYSAEDVMAHTTTDTRIWVTYRSGVYDITEYTAAHPGGRRILMARGKSLEHFWELYPQHKKRTVTATLESLRIGNLKQTDTAAPESRHRLDERPGAGTAPSEVASARNPLPVPSVNVSEYELEVSGRGVGTPLALSYRMLQEQFPRHCVDSTVSCAGAAQPATWCGARLADVLRAAAFDADQGARSVRFGALDSDAGGRRYAMSVPIGTAAGPEHNVLLAYEMDGRAIPLEHGFPVRALVPGAARARSVKWLSRVVVDGGD